MTGAMDRARVAELIVTCAHGRRRGSGYRVTGAPVHSAFWSHINLYGRFRPDMPRCLDLDSIVWWRIAARSPRSGLLRWSVR